MTKQSLGSRIRGWLPQEPKILANSVNSRKLSPSDYRWTAASIVIGSVVGGFLGVLGSFLGLTEGVGAFLWPIMVGLIIGLGTAAVAIYETGRNRYKNNENDCFES